MLLIDFIKSLKSFRELKESTYPAEFKKIKELTSFLSDSTGMSQRCWHIMNNAGMQHCSRCNTKTTWWPRYKKYREFCSNKCVGESDEVQLRKKETCFNNHGVDVPAKSKIVRDAMKNTLIKNYGVDSPLRSLTIKNKAIATWNVNFGKDHPSHKHISDDVLSNLNNKEWLHARYVDDQMTLDEISKMADNVDPSSISRRLITFGIDIRHNHATSVAEKEVVQFLKEMDVIVIENTRSIIPPYELDMFLPDHNIAIEYNGLYWHSEQKGRDKWYHHNKLKKCINRNVRLIQIFEDEWLHRRQQVKQKIMSLIGKDNREKVYARKCQIVEVDTRTKQKFFDDNHVQGDGPSSINVGLTYNNELVAVMGFIKQKNKHYLNRYATKARVIGGFSKLLKHFQLNYKWKKLISFADLRWSDGNLYETTGWTLDTTIEPDYSYVIPGDTKRIHKFNYRRKNLHKLLKNFNPALSERVNCNNNNLLRVWDCGKYRFVIENK